MPPVDQGLSAPRRGEFYAGKMDITDNDFDGEAVPERHRRDSWRSKLERSRSASQFDTSNEVNEQSVPVLPRAGEAMIATVIVLNAVQIGICASEDSPPNDLTFCVITGHFCAVVFLLEFLVKRWWQGEGYFKDQWNWLDFSVVVVAVLDGWILQPILAQIDSPLQHSLILKVFRINPLLRLLRLLRGRQQVRLLLESLYEGFKSMVWVSLLFGLLIYCSANFCIVCFGHIETEDELNFTTIPRACLTLFTLGILGDWARIVAPVMAEVWWAPIFFVAFVLVATFGCVNLSIGVISEKTTYVQEAHRKHLLLKLEEKHMEAVQSIAKLIFDTQDDETITREEMQDMVNSFEIGPDIHDLVMDVELPAGYGLVDCHAMFDRDCSGTINQQEFEEGMRRLIFATDYQRSFMTQAAIADTMVFTKGFEDRITAQITAEFARLRQELKLPPSSPTEATIAKEATAGLGDDEQAYRQKLKLDAEEMQEVATERLQNCQGIVDRLREPLSIYLAEAVIKECELMPMPPGQACHDRLPRPGLDSDGNLVKKSGVIGGVAIGPDGKRICSTPAEGAIGGGGDGRVESSLLLQQQDGFETRSGLQVTELV